ncbi:hypothetical protein DFH06DRAFT_1465811 [Mycena polygramma]|nr:hypothetical protein DFH06DRAFT_1465811 [Mycena polygramma]
MARCPIVRSLSILLERLHNGDCPFNQHCSHLHFRLYRLLQSIRKNQLPILSLVLSAVPTSMALLFPSAAETTSSDTPAPFQGPQSSPRCSMLRSPSSSGRHRMAKLPGAQLCSRTPTRLQGSLFTTLVNGGIELQALVTPEDGTQG